jgi:hypothetical protein
MAIFLAWKFPDFRDNSRLGKGTITENSGLETRTLNHFQISWNIPDQGRGISGKIMVWEKVNNTNLQKSLENSGLQQKVYSAHRRKLFSGPGEV